MDRNRGEGASLGERTCVRDVSGLAVYLAEEVCVNKDIAVGGELLEMKVHAEEKGSLFITVWDPTPLMNLQVHHKQISSQDVKC